MDTVPQQEDWSYAATNQGAAWSWERGLDQPFPEPSEGAWSCGTLISDFQSSELWDKKFWLC